MPRCNDCKKDRPDAKTCSLGEYGWACLCNDCHKSAIEHIIADLVGTNDPVE